MRRFTIRWVAASVHLGCAIRCESPCAHIGVVEYLPQADYLSLDEVHLIADVLDVDPHNLKGLRAVPVDELPLLTPAPGRQPGIRQLMSVAAQDVANRTRRDVDLLIARWIDNRFGPIRVLFLASITCCSVSASVLLG